MTLIRRLFYVLLLVTLAGCSGSSENGDPKGHKTDTSDTVPPTVQMDDCPIDGVDGDCVAPACWFTGAVPEPQPQDFPSEDPSNCDFHQISWQYFLWLTEEVDGQLRFMTMFTDKAIYPETKDDTHQVLDIVEQALSKGVLVDHNNRAVYSNIVINQTYRDWVLNNQLYNDEKFRMFGATNNFPVGSMSIKGAWKIVQPGEDVSKLYTTKADIKLLVPVNGTPRITDDSPTQPGVDVALVGLHIAVVVEGHPEFIWATFEFDDNAPDFQENQAFDQPVSDKNWLFYTAGTQARNANANNAATLAFIDQNAQTIGPITQVARQYVNGGGNATNQGNIENINTSVETQLAEGSIWKNYFEVGAIWFNKPDALQPDWSPNVADSIVTGSLQLSNSVIETFTQKVNSQNECFSCHNTMPLTDVPNSKPVLPGKNANTSHVLLKAYQGGGEVKR